MSEFSRLRPILGNHFQWHGARLTFLAQFLVAVIRVRSVNLSQLSTAFVGKALQASNYKRLQRFFREFRIDYVEFARSIAAWIGVKEDWVLTLDRTQWEIGSQMHNILMQGKCLQRSRNSSFMDFTTKSFKQLCLSTQSIATSLPTYFSHSSDRLFDRRPRIYW